MSKGYWIARVDVHDPEGYMAYLAANAAAGADHDMCGLAAGANHRDG